MSTDNEPKLPREEFSPASGQDSETPELFFDLRDELDLQEALNLDLGVGG